MLSQMNPVHILTPYFFKIQFNMIVPSTSISFKWLLFFRLSY